MKLVELSSPKIGAISRSTPVVIPIAAIEQHGDHMPVWTDSLLLGEIVDRVEKSLSQQTTSPFFKNPAFAAFGTTRNGGFQWLMFAPS